MWLCDSATSRLFLVPGWALPGGCGPAWLAAGWAWPWLARAGPGWLGLALAGWGWPWLHTQHALTKLTSAAMSSDRRPHSNCTGAPDHFQRTTDGPRQREFLPRPVLSK